MLYRHGYVALLGIVADERYFVVFAVFYDMDLSEQGVIENFGLG